MNTGNTHEVTHPMTPDGSGVLAGAVVTTSQIEASKVALKKAELPVGSTTGARTILRHSRTYCYTYSFLKNESAKLPFRKRLQLAWHIVIGKYVVNIKKDVRKKVKRWVN